MRPIGPSSNDFPNAGSGAGATLRQLAQALRRSGPQAGDRLGLPVAAPQRPPQVDRFEPSGAEHPEDDGDVNGIDLKGASKKIGDMLGSVFGDQFEGATISFKKASLTEESGSRAALSGGYSSGAQGASFDYSASYDAYQKSRLDAEGTITTKDGKVFDFKFYETSGQSVSANASSSWSSNDWPSAFTPFDPTAAPAASMSGPADQLKPGIPPTDPRLDRLIEMLRTLAGPQDNSGFVPWNPSDDEVQAPISAFA